MTGGAHGARDRRLVRPDQQRLDPGDATSPGVGHRESRPHVTAAAAARDHQTFTPHGRRGTSGVVVDDGRVQGIGHHGRRYHTTSVPERAAVVVLGDLGRSPRTLYHALALADAGVEVDLVGYLESPLDASTAGNPRIHVHALPSPARATRRWFVARGLGRVVRQAIALRRLLTRLPRPDLILVQNPPAVPTLLIAGRVARARGARFAVDWHNFGYAMLAQQLSPRHPVVALARAYERMAAKLAGHHLCVSEAMRAVLARELGVHGAVVVYDRPAARFAPADTQRRATLRARFAPSLALPAPERPAALVVSPTGWTADEDVGLLLDAVAAYDGVLARAGADDLPDLVLVLTGDGPLRDGFRQRIARLGLRRVHVRTLWLAPDDYPDFLAAADLGVSVHRSTSGCDLPMKIADLHGAGVPVCAFDYGPCLAEMLLQNEESWRFRTADELSRVLLRLLAGFPDGAVELVAARAALAAAPRVSWQAEWQTAAAPVLLRSAAGDQQS